MGLNCQLLGENRLPVHLLDSCHQLCQLERRSPRAGVALRTRPPLGLADERPELVEHERRRRALPVELPDPLEPFQYLPRLVHTTDGTAEGVTCLRRLREIYGTGFRTQPGSTSICGSHLQPERRTAN